jgi:RecB family exonuclease
LLAITDEEFTGCEERGETGYPLIWRYDRAEIRDDLIRWLEAERNDPSFRDLPRGEYEISFGPAWDKAEARSQLSRDEPLEITPEGVELRVIGRIDRLNWSDDGERFRVIDYKTGKVSVEQKEGGKLVGGRAVQLPIYLLVGSELTGIPAERGSSEYHYATRRGGFERRAFTGERLRERRPELDRLLSGIAAAIRSGAYQMAPKDERACTWCDFDRVCPTARHHQIRAKQKAPASRAFAKLREIE